MDCGNARPGDICKQNWQAVCGHNSNRLAPISNQSIGLFLDQVPLAISDKDSGPVNLAATQQSIWLRRAQRQESVSHVRYAIKQGR